MNYFNYMKLQGKLFLVENTKLPIAILVENAFLLLGEHLKPFKVASKFKRMAV